MQVKGIIPAMITPLESNGDINFSSIKNIVEFLITAGVHGLFVNGGQGEFWAFSQTEKQKILQTVVEQVAGRIPVYAGTGAATTREAIKLSTDAQAIGVQAISVITPFYIVPSENEMYYHYKDIATSVNLPVIVYNNPARTGNTISPDLLLKLSNIDNIVGIKDSSGDYSLFLEYLRRTKKTFSVLIGRDSLIYSGLLAGATGSIAATANVAPALIVEIYDKYLKGDYEGARNAQNMLAPLRNAFSLGTFPIVIKEALNLMGFQAGPARKPVGAMTKANRIILKNILINMGLID